MARLPTAEELGIAIPQSGAQVVHLPSSPLGGTIQRLGAVVDQLRDRYDTTKAEAALNTALIGLNDLRYGDTGYEKLNGMQALETGVLSDYGRRAQNLVSDLSRQLSNEPQRRKFETAMAGQVARFQMGVVQHIHQQNEVAEQGNYVAGTMLERQAAARNWNDPTAVAQSISHIDSMVEHHGRLMGATPDQNAAEKLSQISQIHAGVVQSALASRNVGFASEYLEKNRDTLDAQLYDSLRNRVDSEAKGERLRVVAQDAADALVAAGVSPTEGYARIRQHLAGEERSAAEEEYTRQLQRARLLREQSQSDAADQIQARLNGGASFLDIPQSLLRAADPRVVAGMKKLSDAHAAGEDVDTNWDLYYQRRQEAMGDPVAFAKRDLRADFGSLGKQQREALIDLQDKASDPAKLAETRTLDSQISASFAGIALKDTGEKAKAEDAIRQAIDVEQKAAGKNLTADQRQKVIDRELINGAVAGTGWFGTDFRQDKERAYAVPEAQRESFVAGIPDSERQKVAAALKARGIEPTDQNIIDLYQATKRRTKGTIE